MPAAGLVLGINEANPHLVAPGPQPQAFSSWRDRLVALRPRYLRILVDWGRLQPRRTAAPDLAAPADGCLRGLPPCEPFNGLRDQLRAAGAARMTPVLVVLGTPEWAAGERSGCGARRSPRARMPDDLEAYGELLKAVALLAREEGVEPWWSPWNEPNNPDFLSPTRARCDADAPARSPGNYARLVRAARAALPSDARLLLGETAGYERPSPRTVGAAEFARGAPRDVVCAADAWAQHAYIKVEDRFGDRTEPGAASLLADLEGALASHGCVGGPVPIWITETGAEPEDGADGCRAMAGALAAWRRDPRIDVALQYTFREDTAFRVGLVDEGLTELRPAYAAWRAVARGARDPAAACAGGGGDAG